MNGQDEWAGWMGQDGMNEEKKTVEEQGLNE